MKPEYDEVYDEMYDDAYEPTDPKHPSFAEQWLDWADAQRKAEKENGPTERYGVDL